MRLLPILTLLALAANLPAQTAITTSGPIRGTLIDNNQVRAFLGIPYAAPPTGDLRWRAPQPITPWKTPRPATAFGHRCIQFANYSDMVFRDPGPSEDCLTLNIWTPANAKPASSTRGLPVMVWIHGGGFIGGASSEPRQDGASLATRGVIVVSMNYRLGLLGFLTSPQLTAESHHHASGNYGLMDQAAALAWVHTNIRAFGGDPTNVTLFGESAGSWAVSAQMASPLAAGLFTKAIGESGAAFFNTTIPFGPLALRQTQDAELLQTKLGTSNLATLRALSVEALTAVKAFFTMKAFPPCIDGYVLPGTLPDLYAAGRQAHIPLLAGWNADESRGSVLFAKVKPTPASFAQKATQNFGANAQRFLSLYPARTDAEALASAGDYASDQFLVYSTWRWLETQATTGGAPVYRYRLDLAAPADKYHPLGSGAFHADDIEYVFGTLDSRPGATWRPEDRALSAKMQQYWTNFARTGNPNAPGLPTWPLYNASTNWPVLHLDTTTAARPDTERTRYQFLDSIWASR